MELFEEGMAESKEILMVARKNNLKIAEVPIVVHYYGKDSSTHNALTHGVSVLSSIFRYVSVMHPLTFYSLPGFVMLFVSIFFMGWALELFSGTRYISTNMILVSVGT